MGLVPVRQPLLGDQGLGDLLAPRREGRPQPLWPGQRFERARLWGRGLSAGMCPEGTAPVLSAVLVIASPPPCALRSPGITRLHRYSGRSDSCPAALRVLIRDNEPRPGTRAGLPASCAWPSDHSVSNHPPAPRSLSHATPQRRGSFRVAPVRASPFPSRLAATYRPNRVHSRYGPVVHLRLLPTPSREDAVTIGYRPESAVPEEDLHLSDQTHLQTH